MLQALYDEMVRVLEGLKAGKEKIAAYERRWGETLGGRSRTFPCPACFAGGQENAALRPLPAKGGTHYVRCETCSSLFNYEENDE